MITADTSDMSQPAVGFHCAHAFWHTKPRGLAQDFCPVFGSSINPNYRHTEKLRHTNFYLVKEFALFVKKKDVKKKEQIKTN